MLNTTTSSAPSPVLSPVISGARPSVASAAVERALAVPTPRDACGGRTIDMLALLNDTLSTQQRVVHTGDVAYRGGERFEFLYILNSGVFKIVNQSSDGREQVVGFKFRGNWLGFDGIARGRFAHDAVAMDTGEVWVSSYAALRAACVDQPLLLTALHESMSREIAPDRNSLMSVCTLPSDARVADFLCCSAASLADRGLRTDQFTLRMARAEIGNHLGMMLETVS